MVTIASEKFDLTPAIKTHIEGSMSKLDAILPFNSSVHVFLSEPSRKTYSVFCKVRTWGRDFVACESSRNLYAAVDSARCMLTRQIIDEKQRWVRLRKQVQVA